ncbi:DUF262 domain-containing protein [uncultured Brachyspira sp.]|uniref:DUF262 domain-containing protein n=1 Tax=uncultured Brachyspira sp. TaxID=221953 RepID=UPI0026211AD0|nr:DUF262 domain-containing protein [uncultured Brachyspira sp.]
MAETNNEDNKSVEMRSIKKLNGCNFVIPSYQRGYRWRGENGEVQALLEDIKEFIENKKGDEKYCLNPIAVKKVSDTEYNLVDGQQRLTTIYLILKYLNNTKPFTLKYETKQNKEFLDKININTPENDYKQNIDYYHIFEAYKYIDIWFQKDENNQIEKENFKENLLDNVNIIWYDIGSDDENETFQRLNAGKIALTDSELIKAIFLHKSNFKEKSNNNENTEELKKESNNKKKLEELKQINIANQWENIEIELENDKFWYFISNNDNADIRMDFLFELIYDIQKENNNTVKTKYKIFEHFYKKFKDKKNLIENWKELSKYFYILKEWYEDDNLYNDIGYLIASGSRELKTILSYTEDEKLNTKQKFKTKIKEDIKESIKVHNYKQVEENISKLEYNINDTEIRRILLLFNIIDSSKENIRFPFDEYKKIIPSLEHIHARNSKKLSEKEKEKFIEENKLYILQNKELIENEYKNLDEAFNNFKIEDNFNYIIDALFSIYEKLLEDSESSITFEKNYNLDNENNISNLALIDVNNNATLSNSIFPIKLNKIKDLIKNKKKYIPISTKNVFLKYYTNESKDILLWTKTDKYDYLNNIIDSITDYLGLKK